MVAVDRALIERARVGDELAFTRLASAFGDRLFSIAYHIVRDFDPAQEAAQEALILIWQQLPRLRDPDRFEAWAYRITVRVAYAEVGRQQRSRPKLIVMSELRDRVPDGASALSDRDQLERGFRRLSPQHRAVVVLKHYVGLRDDEIAEILEVPVGTVRSRVFYAIKTLRAALEADERSVVQRGPA